MIKKRLHFHLNFFIILIIFLSVFNPWILANFDPSPPLSSETFYQILLLDTIILLILIALIFFQSPKLKAFYTSLFIFLVASSVPFVGLEILLRSSTMLDQVESPNPSYIPKYMRSIDMEIEGTGYLTDEGFRTTERVKNLLDKLKEDKGCKVVILGDSFIWGAGLKPEQRWSDKLSNIISCSVYPFGKNGWTTIEQFSFYEKELLELSFDYLLIGIVENDPHPRGEFLNHKFPSEIYVRTNWGILELFGLNSFHQALSDISYSYDYISQLFSTIITPLIKDSGTMRNPPIVTAGYESWRNRLYKDDVYSIWESVLKDFKEISTHPYGFVLTPTGGNESGEEIWLKIEDTVMNLKQPYVNLYYETSNIFEGKLRPRKLWANRADAHPGDIQNSLYAKGALAVLQEIGYKENGS